MKGKKRGKNALLRYNAFSGAGIRLAAPCLLAAVMALSGCGKAEEQGVDAAARVTESSLQDSTQSTQSTALTEESSSLTVSEEKTTAKTTTKASSPDTQKTGKTTKKSSQTQSVTEQSKAPKTEQTTTKSTDTAGQTQQTQKPNETPANATVTSKAAVTSSQKAAQKTTSQIKENVDDTQSYHIYADGYVTKYDELKLKNLSKKEKEAYKALSEGIWKMQKNINIKGGVIRQEDASDFLYIVLSTMPEVNYVKGTFRISISGGYVKKYSIDYTLDAKEAQSEHRQLRAAAAGIIGSLDPGMSDYDKVKFFHDYIIKNCEYDNEGGASCYTAYGCLVEGKAVCEGYAMALDYLCEKAGIYSLLISGESTNSSGVTQSHIWNKIQLDGKWYNFDVTWDDPVSNFGADYIRYDNFALTDEELSLSHTVDKNKFGYYPKAEDKEQNYFRKNGLYITAEDNKEDIITRAFELSLNEGSKTINLRCDDSETFALVTSLLLSNDEMTGNHMVYTFLSRACEKTGKTADYTGYYLIKNERLNIAAIVLK